MQQQQLQPQRPKPVATAMPSDMYVTKHVGSSVFCSIEGRLVCLHIKTDHTFLITVTQEPLVLHVGTFRFEALTGGRSDASVTAYAKAFIEAFEDTALLSANAAAAATAPTGTAVSPVSQHAPWSSTHASLLGNVDAPDEAVGVELILAGQLGGGGRSPLIASPLYQSHEGSPDGGASFARRSSLVNLHREKLDVEMRDLGESKRTTTGSQQHNAAATGGSAHHPRSEAELLSEANANLVISARVRFSVFGTLHRVVLDLKPCPPQPNIREHMVWGIFMDLYRTVVRQRRDVDRLERCVDRVRGAQCMATRPASSGARPEVSAAGSSGKPVTSPTTSTGGSATARCYPVTVPHGRCDGGSKATHSPRKPQHHKTSTVDFSRVKEVGHAERGKAMPPSAAEANVVDLSALLQTIPSSPRRITSRGTKGPAGTVPSLRHSAAACGSPAAAPILTSPVSPAREGDVAATQRHHHCAATLPVPACPSSKQRPPSAPAPWAYTQHSVYLESSVEATPNRVEKPKSLRPTSASADFQLRCQYVRDVQAKSSTATSAAAASTDQGLLLHPQAPPSATSIRGTFSGRLPQPVATVTISL